MKLSEWVANRVEKTNKNKTTILKELSAKCDVSLLTLQGAERGALMRRYDKAKAVSEGTDGAVTVPDLCETEPMQTKKKKPVRQKRS